MKLSLIHSAFVLLAATCGAAGNASSPLPRSKPEAQGISSAAILDFFSAAADAVIAITNCTRDLQGVVNLVWDKLLPALQSPNRVADEGAQARLARVLAGLTLPPQLGSAAKWAGAAFLFSTNHQKLETVALEFGGAKDPVTLVTHRHGVEHRIACGNGFWTKGRMAYANLDEQPVAASGAWTSDGTYTLKLSFYETPFLVTLQLNFAGEKLFFDSEYNVSFGPTRQPQLVGTPK